MDPSLGVRLDQVRTRIAASAQRAGRSDLPLLIAVSKGAHADKITELISLGVKDFGENRAAALAEKYRQLGSQDGPAWHFIGNLQSNKVRAVASVVKVIHSVDRSSVIRALAGLEGAAPQVLIQVNTSAEPQKSGVAPQGVEALVEEALALGLEVKGLMTIAQQTSDPEQTRPCFRRLRQIRDRIHIRFPGMGIHHLSMGMSQDYEVAVEEGSTMVRIGNSIFS